MNGEIEIFDRLKYRATKFQAKVFWAIQPGSEMNADEIGQVVYQAAELNNGQLVAVLAALGRLADMDFVKRVGLSNYWWTR